jgi:protein SCO1/2
MFMAKSQAQSAVPHLIEDFSFQDQHSHIITQHNIENRIHVANFFFTRCGLICPKMTQHLKMVQDKFGADSTVVILSFSVTPWIDTPIKLKEYADLHEIKSPFWHLLTGSKSSIYQLARQSYFAEEEMGFSKDSTEFLHTEHILLIDKTKRIRGIYNGTLELDIQQLVRDIEVLKEE